LMTKLENFLAFFFPHLILQGEENSNTNMYFNQKKYYNHTEF
jgi:hypothetical protein